MLTINPGLVSDRINKDFGIKILETDRAKIKNYDLILANHRTTVPLVVDKGFIIQTIHGIYPLLEQPNLSSNVFVSISYEIKMYLLTKYNIKSEIILNSIDCNRFSPKTKLNKTIKRVLSLSTKDSFNAKIKKIFDKHNISFISLNKFKNPEWKVEQYINQADMVISLGRGAYESFACGRPVLVMDARKYLGELGDGFVSPGNINEIIKNNCSGRRYRRTDTETMINEAFELYNPKYSDFYREFALKELDVSKQVGKYLWMIKIQGD